MMPETMWGRAARWLAFLPVRLAFRLIWATAIISDDALAIYDTMAHAGLDLPPLPSED